MSRVGTSSFTELSPDHVHGREMKIVRNSEGDQNHLTGIAGLGDEERKHANALLIVSPVTGVDMSKKYVATKPEAFWSTGYLASGLDIYPDLFI